MKLLKYRYRKESILTLMALLTPCAALGQTTVTAAEAVVFASNPTQWVGNYNLYGSNFLVGSPASPIAEANVSMAAHSLSSVSTGNYTPMPPGIIAESYSVSTYLTDTFTVHTSGVVNLGVLGLQDVLHISGSAQAYEGFSLSVDGGPEQTGDIDAVQETSVLSPFAAGPYPQGLSVTVGYDRYGESNPPDTSVWNNSPILQIHATAGQTYTVNAILDSYVSGFVNAPNAAFGGMAGVDPTIYLDTAAGMTYTTGSGYQFASSTPEPSSLLVAGLGCIGLLLRRRRKANLS